MRSHWSRLFNQKLGESTNTLQTNHGIMDSLASIQQEHMIQTKFDGSSLCDENQRNFPLRPNTVKNENISQTLNLKNIRQLTQNEKHSNPHDTIASPITRQSETKRDDKNTCSNRSFEKVCSQTQPFCRNFRGSVKASEIDLQNDTLAYPLHTSESRSHYSRFGNYSIA